MSHCGLYKVGLNVIISDKNVWTSNPRVYTTNRTKLPTAGRISEKPVFLPKAACIQWHDTEKKIELYILQNRGQKILSWKHFLIVLN